MSCSEISNRIRPKYNMSSLKLGGVAFARNVFTDYELIEKQVQMTRHPDNRYCFVVDKNAKDDFKRRIEQLVGCFEDQMVMLPVSLYMDSAGHNQNLGHTQCMEALLRFPNWSYVMLLQNHDLITKSVYELDRIFEIMGGAADATSYWERAKRRLIGSKWDPKSLKFFRNESMVPAHVLSTPLTFVSGLVEASLPRAAVHWLIETVDLTLFIHQLNETVSKQDNVLFRGFFFTIFTYLLFKEYASDEQFMSILQINSQLGMPGHFTNDCLDQGIIVNQVSRFSQWARTGSVNCATKTARHGICLFGIEDLRAMSELQPMAWNKGSIKVNPSFDWSIIDCTAELIFNRTFLGQENNFLDEDYYSQMVTVGIVLIGLSKYHNFRSNTIRITIILNTS
ncbi:hypothetical protein CRE_05031 [Caenorhabditis remanei]|uniref:Uncharacterized protein n=1 Tax=Caenorhabditis remanei TaxID=31234 RepID=E3MZ43_CAERE|nr:hypothetical protein CRE_05031 [Caenorhabditis remanei]